MEKKVKFSTLGCRLNQYETQAVREQFLNAGYKEARDNQKADVLVLNTCTVTGESDRESRRQIRKFHRDNPEAQIVVTGCYVERDRADVEALAGVTTTVLNRQKSELLDIFEHPDMPHETPPTKRRFAPLQISHFDGRTRAYLKVQDGCNHACSFCKVVLARGPSRSRPLKEIIEEATRLVNEGYQEVVLTGIQLGAYGYDLKNRQMLVDLLDALSRISALRRVRLSSIEPTDVTHELITAMASSAQACRHLHIPLQSGSDAILKGMNRRYVSAFYLDLINKLKSDIPEFVLTTDVMVGFPGETNLDFLGTVEVLQATVPYKLHIFPFSPREGTRANRLTNTVAATLSQRRKQILLTLEMKLRAAVEEQFLGKTVEVLLEETVNQSGRLVGRTDHYLKVRVEMTEHKSGDLCPVTLEMGEHNTLIGKEAAYVAC